MASPPFPTDSQEHLSVLDSPSSSGLRSLDWWTFDAVTKGCSFQEPHRLVITTDASLYGWGAHLGPHIVQGQWSQQEQDLNIVLELRAIYLALQSFFCRLRGRDVLILMDNISAKAHMNRQGGTYSRALMHEALRLGLWAETHLASLQVAHILGTANVHADALSRFLIDQAE